jgi:hypothetical protein
VLRAAHQESVPWTARSPAIYPSNSAVQRDPPSPQGNECLIDVLLPPRDPLGVAERQPLACGELGARRVAFEGVEIVP